MNENEGVGESCDSNLDYLCSVKQQDEQIQLACLDYLVHPFSLVYLNKRDKPYRRNRPDEPGP